MAASDLNAPREVIRTVGLLFLSLFFFLHAGPVHAQEQAFTYSSAPLKSIIADLQTRGYRFLYRDALVADRAISFSANSTSLVDSLSAALNRVGIGLQYDAIRRQILLYDQPIRSQRERLLRGQVVDAQSGARLPFATLTWEHEGRLRGVTTNEAGVFSLQLDSELTALDALDIQVSYLGYRPRRLTLQPSALPGELTVRLSPEPIRSPEVLVSSSILETDLDTAGVQLLQAERFSPLGERSVLRALQGLPMVSGGPAMSEGINIRGSKTDGFQVLLDGASIYNQNHFFGFFDVFNGDALQTVGFYYDIAPAHYFGPPGGTLSFITRTGSLNHVQGMAGASHAAVRATLEGPLRAGRSSWLVSGRHSYLDAVDWLNNERLVGVGLDVGRPRSPLPEPFDGVENRLVTPGPTSARFYDAHAKLYAEQASGRRQMLTVYVGGNHTLLQADRLVALRDTSTNLLNTRVDAVETENRWGNESVSFQVQRTLGQRGYVQTLLAGSHYLSRFSKDDFVFTRIQAATGQPRNFIFPFDYENELFDVHWSQSISWIPTYPGRWHAGYSGNYYALFYGELSASRPEFREDYFAIQADGFVQYETTDLKDIDLHVGLRTHYFSQGNAFKWSPRIQLTAWPGRLISFKVGYSRNYQFLHHLSHQNTNSASVWIMTTGASRPSTVDNFTAGWYMKPGKGITFQVEAYRRVHTNLRRHEINAPAGITTANDNRFVPWFSDNRGYARGVEAFWRQPIGPLRWTQGYTLSQVELENPRVNNGLRFPAEWDRRHQFTSQLSVPIGTAATVFASWYYATGAPNILGYDDPAEPERLPDYHRMDAGIQAVRVIGRFTMDVRLSVYNVYDQQNIWYRDPVQVYNRERPGQGFSFVNVDVYDLGVQPGFDVSISW